MIQGHGGNIYELAQTLGCRPEEILDLSSNINPLGMPSGMADHLRDRIDTIGLLPEADGRTATRQMAGLLGVDDRRILAGNGTTHFIYSACPALNARKVLIVGPTYADYADACGMHQVKQYYFLSREQSGFAVDLQELDQALAGMDVVFICNPNNPTGRLIDHQGLVALCQARPKIHFIIDESYLPFVPAPQARSMATCELENVSVLSSMSKIFGLPGLRGGFLIANPATILRFRNFMQPWSLNSLAQAAVEYLYCNGEQIGAFIGETRDFLVSERKLFRDAVAAGTQLTLYPSLTSYFLIGLPKGWSADTVCQQMAQQRILIRNCSNFHGLSQQFVRVALKDTAVNNSAAQYLVEVFHR